jgi:hypothetical protein
MQLPLRLRLRLRRLKYIGFGIVPVSHLPQRRSFLWDAKLRGQLAAKARLVAAIGCPRHSFTPDIS